MHEPWLVGVVPKTPKETVFDEEAVCFGYLIEGPGCVLTPDVYHIQLHANHLAVSHCYRHDLSDVAHVLRQVNG